MSSCAHPRCVETIPSSQFACRTHWWALPESFRREIQRAWQRRRAGLDGATVEHRRAMAAAMSWYADRVRAAEAGDR